MADRSRLRLYSLGYSDAAGRAVCIDMGRCREFDAKNQICESRPEVGTASAGRVLQ